MTERVSSVLHKLRGGVLPVPDPASERARRERIAGRVMELQRDLSRRGERRRRWAVGVALAALIGGLGALLLLVRDDARVTEPAAAAGHDPGVRLVAGHASLRDGVSLSSLSRGDVPMAGDALLVTRAEEGAELRLSSETALSVAPASELGIVRDQASSGGFEERVRLRAGSVALHVPKLGSRGKVSVETSDARVEVHGTQFSVRVVQRPPLEPFTEVQVREGRVLVRSGDDTRFLGAGQHWSSRDAGVNAAETEGSPAQLAPPASALGSPPVDAGSSPARQPAHPRRRASPRSNATPEQQPSASELAAQNRLLEAAQLAQKSGMPGLALQRLDALIARYPDAELAHNARVERFRVLSRMGRQSAAAAAARAYLDRHPSGFARQEAERLLDELPAP
jgi:hypothetical protein